MIKTFAPLRLKGQTDVLGLRCEPLSVVRIGFIGLGYRGKNAIKRLIDIEGIEIKAICDLIQDNLDEVQTSIIGAGLTQASEYVGPDGWKEVCKRTDIDLIYNCTDWDTHTPMAVYAMENDKHVALEVPAALTIKECWALVDTAERTRKHCIMLENCCYDRFEMTVLNMSQQGLLGEIIHVEGAYIHDLRSQSFGLEQQSGACRKKYQIEYNGNPYPTHGLGPVCQLLNIHRGDKMNHLVSISSGQFGMTAYAKKRFGIDSNESNQEYCMGDMNTTIIKTQRGKTIMIQHDITSPRPYSRIYAVSGTYGFAQKWPSEQISIEGEELTASELLVRYEHPFYKNMKKSNNSAPLEKNDVMDNRLIYCLRNGLPLDQDVYDAAEWSCLVELTEISVKNNGAPVEIPDFTRGAWNKINGLKFY